jgi:hypothetical protein
MSPKSAKKPSRSIRYFLSSDRRLERLSLRRLSSLRPKSATKPLRSMRPGKPGRASDALRSLRAISPGAIAIGVIGVLTVAALVAAGRPSRRSDVASAEATPDQIATSENAATTPRVEPKKTAVTKASVADSTPRAEADATPAIADAHPMAAVTITGCLAVDNDTFWLKDTSGADAPKSRSWKSGFLKKRPASVELVDPAHSLKLTNYVGRRIAATGVLANGEMRARSLQRVAASCS